MALKRVCDITGTDRDVEICDVTIAGQTVKLDLSLAGAQKLREFFGPVVTVRHPAEGAVAVEDAASAEDAVVVAASQDAQIEAGDEPAEAEDEDEETPEETEPDGEPESAVAQRPARRGRRAAAPAKNAPKKSLRGQKKPAKNSVSRRAVAVEVTPGTSEIREWARANGFEIGERGAIPGRIRSAYTLAHE